MGLILTPPPQDQACRFTKILKIDGHNGIVGNSEA